jgi:flagellar assembly factor FliW
MKINTYQFGEIEYTEDKVIKFQDGLMGFENLKNYLFIKSDDGIFYWLNSIDDPGIAFPLFGIRILDDQFPQQENHEAFGVVVLNSNPSEITINLKAPVYINQNSKEGYQRIIDSDKYPVNYNLFTGQ